MTTVFELGDTVEWNWGDRRWCRARAERKLCGRRRSRGQTAL